MNKPADIKLQRIIETVRDQFSFLFQRGYRINSALFSDAKCENWSVVLAGEEHLVSIQCQGREIHLALCSLELFDKTGLFDLNDLVHWMNRDEDPPSINGKQIPTESDQLRKAAHLLENHMEEIFLLFQRIHLGIAFDTAGQLINDNCPAFFI